MTCVKEVPLRRHLLMASLLTVLAVGAWLFTISLPVSPAPIPKAIINFLTLMRSKNSSNKTGKKVTIVMGKLSPSWAILTLTSR